MDRVSELAMRRCVQGATPSLRQPELDDLLARLGNDWRVVDEHDHEKELRFKDFREALDFTNRVENLAERQRARVRRAARLAQGAQPGRRRVSNQSTQSDGRG